MRLSILLSELGYIGFCLSLSSSAADTPPAGIQQRVPWTTSRVLGTPDPPLPFITEPVFPALKFDQCLDVTSAPGSDRLFVVQQHGKIYSFPVHANVESADLVIDLANEIKGVQQVYALAFHPKFAENRYCFVCYIKDPGKEDGTHIARFRMSDTNPPTIDVTSETTIITWWSGGHNGCCLKFGPDGYLYISTGDAESPNPPDLKQTGQDVSDLLSSILRIDVDVESSVAQGSATEGSGKPAETNYRIPPDNPFVTTEGARGEIWAYGFRNPWRMSFDRETGELWVGDVGWELWELLDCVERGGNYGWSVMEGRQSTNPEWPRGPTPILPPTIDHPHSESSSITDGLTYYGARLTELHGTHIYGDYDTGKIWGFRYENGHVVNHRELADTTHRIVGFGEDHHGELYLLDHTAGTIHRLVPNPHRDQPGNFPRKLSETGLVSGGGQFAPAPGVISYSINAEPWADNSRAERWVAVPDDLTIQAQAGTWSFPENTVLVKTISLDMEQGNLDSRQHIETQILHFDGVQWNPYAYRWNEEQSDALLLDAGGGEQVYEIVDPLAPDGKRRQTWRFAGRSECQRCHNRWSGPPLAFNTPQLNKYHNYNGMEAAQLETLAHVGLLKDLPDEAQRTQLADPSDPDNRLDGRARAYLQVNCAHCHRQHAGSSVLSKMHYDLPLGATDMLDVRPTQGTFGIHGAKVIAPGDPFRSVLLYRMSKLGGGRMPHIGSTEVDCQGVKLISEWIRRIPEQLAGEIEENSEIEQNSEVVNNSEVNDNTDAAAATDELATLFDQLCATPDSAPEQLELVQRLLTSTTGAMRLLQGADDRLLSEQTAALVIQQASEHHNVNVRDLFERFLPDSKRSKRLGSVVQSDDILSLPGDAEQGRQLFFVTEGIQCKSCHRIQDQGQEVGPDLTQVGAKYNRAQILESILAPSKLIDPKYVTYLAETEDGRLVTGVMVSSDGQEVVLKDAQGNVVRIPADEVETLVRQQQSLMPELLLRDMTAQQVADLLTYLSEMK